MAWYDFITIFNDLAALQRSINSLNGKLDKILTFVDGKRPATRVRIDVDASKLLDKKGHLIMSGAITLTTDHDERVPLKWADDVGAVSAPTSGTTATSDNPAIATVDVAADDLSIVVRSVAVGSCNVAVANGPMSDSIVVNVTAPAATVLDVDATDAVLIPKGTAA